MCTFLRLKVSISLLTTTPDQGSQKKLSAAQWSSFVAAPAVEFALLTYDIH